MIKDFLGSFLGLSLKYSGIALVLVGIGIVVGGDVEWIPGMILTWAWLFFNCLMLFRIVRMVEKQTQVEPKKIFFICLVKFPVLYLLGLLILLLPFVRLAGVLVSFTAFLALTPLAWWRKKSTHT